MERMIMLLRGINVGGHNKLKMADLRESLAWAGLGDVRTYIQSGNIAADTELAADALGEKVHAVIAEDFGLAVSVMVRSQAEVRALRDAACFAEHPPNQVLVLFAGEAIDSAAAQGVLDAYEGPEKVLFRERELVVWFSQGQGRSKFPIAKLERALGGLTGRNWNGVVKLSEL